MLTCFAMVGLVLSMINYEYVVVNTDHKKYKDPMQLRRSTNAWSSVLRLTTSLTTLLSVCCLYMRHRYQMKWHNNYSSSIERNPNHISFMYDEIINMKKNEFGLLKTVVSKQYIIELLILLIHPIPYFDTYIILVCNGSQKVAYLLSDFLFELMFLRLFFLIRTSFNYSIYTDPVSRKICKSYGFSSDLKFALKCKLLIEPERAVCVMFISTVCLFAYMIRIFELPYLRQTHQDTRFDSYFNAVWFTMITLTTIGYGDVSPGSIPGKIITMLLAFWGAIFLALLVATVSNIFNLTTEQEQALRHVRLTRHAASAISQSI